MVGDEDDRGFVEAVEIWNVGVAVRFGIGSHSRDGPLMLQQSRWNERDGRKLIAEGQPKENCSGEPAQGNS